MRWHLLRGIDMNFWISKTWHYFWPVYNWWSHEMDLMIAIDLLVTIPHIKNSSDNWQNPSWFMKSMAVNVWYYIKEINFVFVFVIICSVTNNLIITSTWRWRKQYYSALIQRCFLGKETPTYWKFKDKISKLF